MQCPSLSRSSLLGWCFTLLILGAEGINVHRRIEDQRQFQSRSLDGTSASDAHVETTLIERARVFTTANDLCATLSGHSELHRIACGHIATALLANHRATQDGETDTALLQTKSGTTKSGTTKSGAALTASQREHFVAFVSVKTVLLVTSLVVLTISIGSQIYFAEKIKEATTAAKVKEVAVLASYHEIAGEHMRAIDKIVTALKTAREGHASEEIKDLDNELRNSAEALEREIERQERAAEEKIDDHVGDIEKKALTNLVKKGVKKLFKLYVIGPIKVGVRSGYSGYDPVINSKIKAGILTDPAGFIKEFRPPEDLWNPEDVSELGVEVEAIGKQLVGNILGGVMVFSKIYSAYKNAVKGMRRWKEAAEDQRAAESIAHTLGQEHVAKTRWFVCTQMYDIGASVNAVLEDKSLKKPGDARDLLQKVVQAVNEGWNSNNLGCSRIYSRDKVKMPDPITDVAVSSDCFRGEEYSFDDDLDSGMLTKNFVGPDNKIYWPRRAADRHTFNGWKMACSSSSRPVGLKGGENGDTPESRRVCELNRKKVPTKEKHTDPKDINERFSICRTCGTRQSFSYPGSQLCLRGDDKTFWTKSWLKKTFQGSMRSKALSNLRKGDKCAGRKSNEGIADGSSRSRVLVFTRDKGRQPIQDLTLVRFNPQQKIANYREKMFYQTFSNLGGITLLDSTFSDQTLYASPNLDALAVKHDKNGEALHYIAPSWSPKDQAWAMHQNPPNRQILHKKYPYRILTRKFMASPSGLNHFVAEQDKEERRMAWQRARTVLKQTLVITGVTENQINVPEKLQKVQEKIADYLGVEKASVQIKDVKPSSSIGGDGVDLEYQVNGQGTSIENTKIILKMKKMGEKKKYSQNAVSKEVATQAGWPLKLPNVNIVSELPPKITSRTEDFKEAFEKAYEAYQEITINNGVNMNIETHDCTNPSHHFLTDLNYKRAKNMDSIFGIKVHQRPPVSGASAGTAGEKNQKNNELPPSRSSGNFPPLRDIRITYGNDMTPDDKLCPLENDLPTPVVTARARDGCPWWRIVISPNRGHKGDKNEIMGGVYVWVFRNFQVPNSWQRGAPDTDTGDWLRPALKVDGVESEKEGLMIPIYKTTVSEGWQVDWIGGVGRFYYKGFYYKGGK